VNYFLYRNQPILFSLIGVSERPAYEDARKVVSSIRGPLEAGEIDQVQLVYTRFVSLGSQSVDVRPMIPLVREDTGADGPDGGSERTVYEFEPEPDEILDRLIPSWLEAEVLTAMLEAAASEQASRQRAMKAATDNADELIKNLRRIMNRARQDAITTEIMEIVGGAEALRQQSGSDESGLQHDTFAPIPTA
jgi:F-type H+-transporting ATPase subunit gamma